MRTFAALLLVTALGTASAAVVTFDGYQPLYDFSQSTVQTEGFIFSVGCVNCMGVEDRPPTEVGGNPLPGAFNGTPSLIYSVDPLSITAVDGGGFFLDRLDLGLSWYVPDVDVGSAVTISYVLAAGGTGSVQGALDRSYGTFLVGQQVLSVSISGGRGFGYVTLDNLVVNTVPEPESAGLALAALLCAGAATGRRAQRPS